MRIAFDHQIFGWQQYGGISRYAYELAAGLTTVCGQDVSIMAPLFVNEYLNGAPPQLKVRGVRVPVFKQSGRIYRAINSMLVRPSMRRLNPDIVHETYYSTAGSAPRGSRTVLTVYDMIHERFPTYFSKLSPTRREKSAAVSRADHVICISEQTKIDLMEYLGVSSEKLSVIHLGFSPLPGGHEAQKPLELARPYLLYVGNRGGHKNFSGLLRAYAGSKLLTREFDLICFGGGELSQMENELLKELGVPAGRVRQIAGGDSLLGQYYASAFAFVYPSLYEGFGIPPLEAMSYGCPVICSNTSSIPEVVGDAAMTFNPQDRDSILDSIEKLVGNNALRSDLIERGRARAKSFSWERCAKETLEVYEQVCT